MANYKNIYSIIYMTLIEVKYKGVTYKIPKKYIEGLKGYPRRRKIKSIVEGKSKTSSTTEEFKEKYGNISKIKDISEKTGMPQKALEAIIMRGKQSYYKSKVPNSNAFAWGRVRMYSFILGDEEIRKLDSDIIKKYNIKL